MFRRPSSTIVVGCDGGSGCLKSHASGRLVAQGRRPSLRGDGGSPTSVGGRSGQPISSLRRRIVLRAPSSRSHSGYLRA